MNETQRMDVSDRMTRKNPHVAEYRCELQSWMRVIMVNEGAGMFLYGSVVDTVGEYEDERQRRSRKRFTRLTIRTEDGRYKYPIREEGSFRCLKFGDGWFMFGPLIDRLGRIEDEIFEGSDGSQG